MEMCKTNMCLSCGEKFAKLATHLKKNPLCMEQSRELESNEEIVAVSKRPRPQRNARTPKTSDTHAIMFANKLRSTVALSRLELHEDMFMPLAHADRSYQQVFCWMDLVMNHVLERVKLTHDAEGAVKDAWARTVDVMKEVITWDTVRSTVYKSMQIKPLIPTSRSSSLVRTKNVAEGRHVHRELAEISIIQLITQLLQCDDYARQEILLSSDLWKTGELYCVPPEHYNDITDGEVFRNHPELARAARAEEHDDIRVALYLYTDDFTSVNAIGTKRGAHKYSVHMAAIANLPTRVRFKTEYILPFLIAQSKLVESAGLNQILCGVNADGVQVDENNFAADMRQLARGVAISIPDDANGGMRYEPHSHPPRLARHSIPPLACVHLGPSPLHVPQRACVCGDRYGVHPPH